MSNVAALSAVCKDQTFEVENSGGTVYLRRTSTAKDFRGQPVNHPTEILFAISPEEASYVAAALRIAIGEENPMEPKERIVT